MQKSINIRCSVVWTEREAGAISAASTDPMAGFAGVVTHSGGLGVVYVK